MVKAVSSRRSSSNFRTKCLVLKLEEFCERIATETNLILAYFGRKSKNWHQHLRSLVYCQGPPIKGLFGDEFWKDLHPFDGRFAVNSFVKTCGFCSHFIKKFKAILSPIFRTGDDFKANLHHLNAQFGGF